MMSKGINIYTVTAELNAEDIFNPITLAVQEMEKSTNQ
jgi:hypothetical protein